MLGQPEVTLGHHPRRRRDAEPAAPGPDRAGEALLFTGERITAARGAGDRPRRRGRAARDGTRARRSRWRSAIARNAPLAVTAAKRAVNLGLQMSVLDGHRLEATLFAPLAETERLRRGRPRVLREARTRRSSGE